MATKASKKDTTAKAAEASATTIVGEENAPITTLALGEEHVVTTIVGEQVQHGPELAAAVEKSKDAASATTVVGEAWHPHMPVTTLVEGEETTPLVGETGGGTLYTTLAVGEEDPATTVAGEGPTTKMLGEEGPIYTTDALGEEGPVITTLVGEQSQVTATTTVVGEEGPVMTTIVGEHHHVPITTTVAGEDAQGGSGSGGAFGNF
jgi:hypothetical protein